MTNVDLAAHHSPMIFNYIVTEMDLITFQQYDHVMPQDIIVCRHAKELKKLITTFQNPNIKQEWTWEPAPMDVKVYRK